MTGRQRWTAVGGLLLASLSHAAGASGCGHSLLVSLQECERIVGSLRADKAGRMRMFAPDGAEYSAAEATWMTHELQLIAEDCAQGEAEDAARRLDKVRRLLAGRAAQLP